MNRLLEAIESHARLRGARTALQTRSVRISYADLSREVQRFAQHLARTVPKRVGILADNGPGWVLVDLAAMLLGIPVVPLPHFFSPSQLRQAIERGGIDFVFADQSIARLSGIRAVRVGGWQLGDGISGYRIDREQGLALPLPPGTCKVTFTSGSTGAPKGVCLSLEGIERAVASLMDAAAARAEDRHLCVSPLSTLLENIAGVYVPLMAGATSLVPSLSDVGLRGSSGLDIDAQLSMMEASQASTAVIVPQMLAAQVSAMGAGAARPSRLRYLAVGGASVSPRLLERAAAMGLPVFQGYGLSECGSVVALNTPAHNRIGSAGRPLSHLRVSVEPDGEVIVHGSNFLGYLGDAQSRAPGAFATGDIGALDEDGYLYIVGRKKNVFVTSFGRNVSPEWVEGEFLLSSCLLQIAVFGEARPYNIGVIVPRAGSSPGEIADAIESVNASLPDYARVKGWIAARGPFSPTNGQLSHNGRLKRPEIHAAYARELEALWNSSHI